MAGRRVERVVQQPGTQRKLLLGVNQIVEAIRPTLGPLPRLVAVERAPNNKAPELLDNGAAIARRIIALPDRDADMGAMFLRQMLWRLHETTGDGTATAAILFQSVYAQALRYIAAGGNAMRLRPHLEQAGRSVAADLAQAAVPLGGRPHLDQAATAVCGDAQVARYLAEIFDRIGAYGQLEVRSAPDREVKRQYVEGIYWRGGAFSRHFLEQATGRVDLAGAAILISDLAIEAPQQLVAVLEATARAGIHSLVVVASKLSESVIGLMQANQNPARLRVIGVKVPEATPMGQTAALEDIAVLTGGRPIAKADGRGLAGVRLEDLGRAGRAWADRYYFGVVDGNGGPADIARHLGALQARHDAEPDVEARKKLQQRIGTLRGKTAILWVGGATKTEHEVRKKMTERAAETLRSTVREGVVPGGGAALLACRDRLQARRTARAGANGRVVQRILDTALEQPLRQIAANAGYDPGQVMAEVGRAGPGCGFDVRTGLVSDMLEAGILDSAAVLRSAVQAAFTSAALLLTVDVLVHHRNPATSTQP